MNCRMYSFQNRTQFSQGNNVPDGTASNTHRFLSRHICVSSPYLNRPIWSKMSLSTWWNIETAGNITLKNGHNSHRETLCSMLLLFTQMVFFERFIGFFHLAEWACLQQSESCSSLKTMICRMYSFQLISILTGKLCLDDTASDTNGFLSRDTCVSSSQLNRPICCKGSLTPVWKP
jgi:hypothetical protein